MNAARSTNGFSEKNIFRDKRANLGLKLAHSHNFGATFFLKSCTMKGTNRYMEIMWMVFLKKQKNRKKANGEKLG